MTAFSQKVAAVVRSIPRGRTLSYGEVAVLAGRPGGARAVASALRVLEEIPWWRVTQRGGFLAPAVAHRQAQRLQREGRQVKSRRLVPRPARAPAARPDKSLR